MFCIQPGMRHSRLLSQFLNWISRACRCRLLSSCICRERGNGSSAELSTSGHGDDGAEPCLAVFAQTTLVQSRHGHCFAFIMRNVAMSFLLHCDQWSLRSIAQWDVWLRSHQRTWFDHQQGQCFAFNMRSVPVPLEAHMLIPQDVHCSAVSCLRAMTRIMLVRYPRGARVVPAELEPARSCAHHHLILPCSIFSDTHPIIILNVHIRPDYYHL